MPVNNFFANPILQPYWLFSAAGGSERTHELDEFMPGEMRVFTDLRCYPVLVWPPCVEMGLYGLCVGRIAEHGE